MYGMIGEKIEKYLDTLERKLNDFIDLLAYMLLRYTGNAVV